MQYTVIHIIRPYRTYYVRRWRPIVTDRVAWSICHTSQPFKNDWTDRDAIELWTSVGSRNHVLDGDQIPHANGKFWGGKDRPIVKYRDTQLWAVQKRLNRSRCRVGSRKHVLDRVQIGATWRIRVNRPCTGGDATFLWSPYGIEQTIIFSCCGLFFFLLSSFFSSPNLSRRRLDVCHTSTHGVALVRI